MTELILFNKPYGVLTQFTGEHQDQTLANYIQMPGFYAAGRLDKNSEGLLLLSNNGAFQHHLTHPKFSKKKYYWVQIEGIPTPRQLQPLRDGLRLRDTQFLPAEVTLIDEPSCLWARTPPIRIRQNIPTSWLEVILKEGKNHQIRKMTAAVGFPTLRLIRHQIGEWKLGGLMPGEYRILKDHGYTTLPILETTVQRSITQQTNPRPKKHS